MSWRSLLALAVDAAGELHRAMGRHGWSFVDGHVVDRDGDPVSPVRVWQAVNGESGDEELEEPLVVDVEIIDAEDL